jgi:transcriptional regulator with XRE-family HTH domain
MLTQDKIDRFYEDIKRLGLKRPVAVVASRTGLSKGNVSSYLNKKQPPSEQFINKFYESFSEELKALGSGAFSFNADRDKLIVDMLKDIIKLNARVDVLSITLADIVSKVDKKAIATADSELIDAANRRNEALLDEWKKKIPGL